jgi:hypothetical protein
MEALLDIGMLVCFIGGPALLLRVVMRRPQMAPFRPPNRILFSEPADPAKTTIPLSEPPVDLDRAAERARGDLELNAINRCGIVPKTSDHCPANSGAKGRGLSSPLLDYGGARRGIDNDAA